MHAPNTILAFDRQVTPAVRTALMLLLEAHRTGAGFGCDPLDFALEGQALKDAGLSHNDLRALICEGHAEHLIEWTRRGAKRRTFRRPRSLRIETRSCFILTPTSLELARELARPAEPALAGYHTDDSPRRSLPYWDDDLRELRVGTVVAKRFRQRAKNQETILAAFQEEGWPPRIDNPLSGDGTIGALERLHDAVKRLNRQRRPALSFHSDGRDGIVWHILHFSTATHERPMSAP